MAETSMTAPTEGSARLRDRPERVFLGAIVSGFGLWLALSLGLDAAFGLLGTAGEVAASLLPWLALAAAALAALALIRTSGALVLRGNRLGAHILGWGLLALLFLGLYLFGDLLRPTFRILGKPGTILLRFTADNGPFFAAFCALIALALAGIGSAGKLTERPAAFERGFVGNFTAKVAAIPMLLVALGIFFGGTIWTVVYSFTDSKLLPRTNFVGLAQYERLWGEPRWIVSIENLAIYGMLSLILQLLIGFLLAVLLDQKIRFENTFRTILLYPFALSFIVTGLVWQWILNPDFGVQHIVRSLGFESFVFDPIYDASIVIYGVLLAALWQGTGLVMCLMLAGLRGIDEDIWKASRIDGIPAWKTYLFIVVPMMRPVFITTLVIIAAGIVKVYDLIVAQTSGGPGIASEVPAKYVYDKMFLGQNLGQGFAASTMMLLSVLIVLIPWAYLEFGGRKRG